MDRLPQLILASTSPYRRALLARLRVPFDVVAPAFEEVRLDDPDATVRTNALGKARAAAVNHPDAAILASDQVAYCEGRTLEKPGTPEVAIEQLTGLAGREHTLHTAVVLRLPDGREGEGTIVARLRIRPLTRQQIAAYVRLESPLDCAGSYKSEGLGTVLFEWIRCDDPTAIEGLPLTTTSRLLEKAGWNLLDGEGGAA